jgi:DNA-binding CsgD family transcriptional regulator/tetratricopeptide (TPR) repeat protein
MAAADARQALHVRPVATGRTASSLPPTGPLVGRSRELLRLEETFDLVTGGRAMGVLVAGDAVVGKSRVIEEFCDRVRLRGAVVAIGLCMPADNAVPYAPVVGVLRDLGRVLGSQPRPARLLESMASYLDLDKQVFEETDDPTAVGEFRKTMLFESVLREVAQLAEDAAVVVVFEDLHWADSASSELFDYLIRNLVDARVLTLGSYRDEELDAEHPLTPRVAELLRHPRVRQLAVKPLERRELEALVANALGKAPSPTLLDSVWGRSRGNPLFAEQLVAEGDPTMLPSALKAVIDHRVRQLPEPAQRLLELMATAGLVVRHDLVASASRLSDDALESALLAAIDKKLLVVDGSQESYRFRHALLREAVYERLLPTRKRRLHQSIAVALEQEPALAAGETDGLGQETAQLASHWWAAQDWAKALPVSLQAADVAIAALAFPEALTLLERALTADTSAPGVLASAALTRSQLLEKAADVAYLAGASVRAVELAEQAVAAVDPVNEPLAAVRCYTLLGRNLWGVGDSAAAFDGYEAALGLLPDESPSIERAGLLAEQARGYMLLSRFAVGVQYAAQALEVARAAGSRRVEGHALNTLGVCRGELVGYDEGIPLIRQSLEIAEEIASPEDLNRAYANLSQAMLDTGRLDEAASMVFDCAAVGEDLWGCRLNGGSGNGVEAMVRLGRYADAEQLLGLLGNQALGVCSAAPWILPSPMLIRRGEFDAADRAIAYAIDMTSRLQDVMHAAVAHGLAGELALERGLPDEACEALSRARAVASRSDDETVLPELFMWSVRAVVEQYEAARMSGENVGAARERAAQFVAGVSRIVESRERRGASPTPRQRGALAQCLAEQSRLGRSDPDLWERAARLWETASEAYPQAYCRWREAEALLEARVARARATAALVEAQRIAQRLELRPLLGRISRLSQRGRLEIHADAAAEPTPAELAGQALGLTPREVEVLGLLVDGSTDRDIAEALFISRKTVSVHVSNVLRKLAVGRRFEAARIGQAHGLGATIADSNTGQQLHEGSKELSTGIIRR